MGVEVTTVSVHPKRAERLREIRDAEEHPNLDATLDELINHYEER